jgi:hypothetical protein
MHNPTSEEKLQLLRQWLLNLEHPSAAELLMFLEKETDSGRYGAVDTFWRQLRARQLENLESDRQFADKMCALFNKVESEEPEAGNIQAHLD